MGETPLSGGGTDAGASAPAPSSFAEAFAAEASPASDPSAQTTTPATAAESPSGAEVTPADDRSPFIPRSRFDEVNTRLKTAESWKQQHAWAETIPQGELQKAIELARRASADPVGYLQDLIAEVQAHPQHGQALKSLAARALAARSAPAETDPQPDLPIQLDDGRVVHLYSAEQQAKREAYLEKRWLAAVDEKYRPVVQTHEAIAKRHQAEIDKAEGDTFATEFTGELTTLFPAFKAHKDQVGQEVVRMLAAYANDPRVNDRSFLEALTLRAAQKVLGPLQQATAESSVLDTLQRKAAASSSVNPGSAAPSSPRSPKGFHDPALQW